MHKMAFSNNLLVAVLCGTLWALAAAQPGDDCPQFWSYYSGSCYTLIHNPSSWAGAEEICKDFQGYLAEIEDDLENKFVKGLIDAANATGMLRYWIGGNDLLSESAWMWSHSGQDVQFTDWSPGNPSNSGHTENCLEILRSTPHVYQWNDNKCSAHQYFVCEKGVATNPMVG